MAAEGEDSALLLLRPRVIFDPKGRPSGSSLAPRQAAGHSQEFSACVESSILSVLHRLVKY